jgi:3'-phosphoadenosine 5'-phosphosulfate sulfotransferase (PAPS reductase)/FAD synthetase
MLVFSVSYGNDSLAMLQWAIEADLEQACHAVYIDTGWAGHGWPEHVDRCEAWAGAQGFDVHRIQPEVQFRELIELKKGFPNQRYQWCSGLLKGIPFLNWLDRVDPDNQAAVFVGKRREESRERAETPCVTYSEYHGGRMLVHPLYRHSEHDRNVLLEHAGFEPVPHRSLECDPCVNSNRADFRRLHEDDIRKASELEAVVGKTMFRPVRHRGAVGVEKVVVWAKSKPWSRESFKEGSEDDPFATGCGSPFGCGL